MADFTIELVGKQFKRAYLLYIVEIIHNEDRYYYVGQTGDRNYVTARPAFRRLSGHLDDSGNSTENQIYKYIVTGILHHSEVNRGKYSEECKQDVENFLVNSTILMHIYTVLPFDPKISHIDHRNNVNNVVQLERHVIKAMVDSGKCAANKANYRPSGPCPYPELLSQIKKEFGL